MSKTGPVVKQGAVSGIPNLTALLHPGPLARKAAEKIPLVAPEQKPELPSMPAPTEQIDRDYLRIDLPPRSPETIAALIASGETDAERAQRMHNDIQRFRRMRGLQ